MHIKWSLQQEPYSSPIANTLLFIGIFMSFYWVKKWEISYFHTFIEFVLHVLDFNRSKQSAYSDMKSCQTFLKAWTQMERTEDTRRRQSILPWTWPSQDLRSNTQHFGSCYGNFQGQCLINRNVCFHQSVLIFWLND